jgi:ketosteroid isomerase-like protein
MVDRFLEALERGDREALAATLAPDVVFRSPITNSARFEGHARVMEVYGAVLSTLTEIRGEVIASAGDLHIAHGTARAGGQFFEETMHLRVGTDGRIREIRMFVRDLVGLTALTGAIGPAIARTRGRWRGPLVALLTRPLAVLVRLGDGIVARVAAITR